MPADLTSFSAGFLLSSAASFALAAWLGAALASALGERSRLALLLGTVLALLAVDVARSRRGLTCSLGLRRQTPRRLGYMPLGPFLWGLDTGLPVTTYRATPPPFLGLACVALGFGHPWIGLAYAAGFLGSLWTSCAWRRSGDPLQPEPRDPLLQVIQALRSYTRPAWAASQVVAGGLLLLLAAQVFASP